MSGNFSDDLAHDLLDLVFGGVAYSPAATFELRLYTATPGDAGGGTPVSTGEWTNYADVVVTRNQTNFPASSSRTVSNGVILDFGTPTVPGTEPQVVAVGVHDATSDRLEGFAILNTAKTISDGDPVTFPIGDLDFIIIPTP